MQPIPKPKLYSTNAKMLPKSCWWGAVFSAPLPPSPKQVNAWVQYPETVPGGV
jgi:hypothetical protein